MGDDPFKKILKYIEEQRKMPHVATTVALKELTWPPASKAPAAPPSKDVAATFPSAADRAAAERKAAQDSPPSTDQGVSDDDDGADGTPDGNDSSSAEKEEP